MSKALKSYPAETVIRAQKRVLRMVFDYMSHVQDLGMDTLITDGKGLMTLRTILDHVRAASNLKVSHPSKKPRTQKKPVSRKK